VKLGCRIGVSSRKVIHVNAQANVPAVGALPRANVILLAPIAKQKQR